MSLVNSTTHKQKKPRLRDRTDKAWFSRLLRHPARKWSGSILSTPEPAWDVMHVKVSSNQVYSMASNQQPVHSTTRPSRRLATHLRLRTFQGRAQDFAASGGQERRPRAGLGFLGKGQQSPPHQLEGLEECCEFPQRGSDHPKVFHYFQHSGWPLLTV